MLIALTDYQQADIVFEKQLVTDAGHEFRAFQCRSDDDVIKNCKGATALFAQYAPITARVFEALPDLEIVSINAVGTDSIDLEAAKSHGVWVSNVPGASTNEVATHALSLALSGIRRLPLFDRSVSEGQWSLDLAQGMRRPSEMTLGIVGFGAIGQELARIAAPSFKEIVAYDPFQPDDRFGGSLRRGELDDLFEVADIISLHLPLTAETNGLVSDRLLSRTKTGAYLVNVARGELVDQAALIRAIDRGQLLGAGLDVLSQEPPDPNGGIVQHPAIQITPHIAYFSEDSELELRQKAIGNILTWHDTGTPPNAVVTGAKRS